MHVGSGDAKEVWHLPERLLKSKSTFFTAALEGGFAEGLSKNITLPEENPGIFKYFVGWLYTGSDPIAKLQDQDFVVPLWFLGDLLGCPLMQDDAMCALLAWDSAFIDEDILKQIYESSAQGSKIRRFVIDRCLYDIRRIWPERHEEGCPYLQFVKHNEDFAQQLAEATLLLGDGEAKDPFYEQGPYLFAPIPYTSETRSGSCSSSTSSHTQ